MNKYFLTLSSLSIFLLLFVFIGTVFVTSFGSHWAVVSGIKPVHWFQKYTNFNILIMTVCCFVFFKGLNNNFFTAHQHIIRFVSTATFGVYLVHPIILNIISRILDFTALDSLYIGVISVIPIQTIITFLLSLAFTVFIQRVPLIRHIVP